MAKVVKMREVEIGLEEVIRLLKKNWSLLAGFLTCHLLSEKKIIRVSASFNLASVSNALNQAEGLIADRKELEGAINQVFRDIEHQRPHLKNMTIVCTTPAHPLSLDVSFDIDIAPVMPVDSIDIPGPDNPVDPDPNCEKRLEIMQLVR